MLTYQSVPLFEQGKKNSIFKESFEIACIDCIVTLPHVVLIPFCCFAEAHELNGKMNNLKPMLGVDEVNFENNKLISLKANQFCKDLGIL